MRILNVVDEFHPEAGYENNVLSKFMVKNGYEYEILTSAFLPNKHYYLDFLGTDDIEKKDRVFYEQTGVKVTRLENKHFISGRAIWKYRRFLAAVKTIDPDVLFFCGNDTFIFCLFLLKNKKAILKGKLKWKILADSHMLDMASKNKLKSLFYLFYRLFITPIVKKANIKVIRVQDDPFVQKRLGIPLNQSPFISFGTDTLLFRPDSKTRSATRKELGIENDAFVVIYAGKINESKGGMLLADAIHDRIDCGKKIAFVILANATSDYERAVLNKLRSSNNQVAIHKAVSYINLDKYYKCADLAVFPKQCSLSFYDVQACGVPVLLEDNDINIGRTQFDNGFLFKANDVTDLRNKLCEIAKIQDYDFYRRASLSFIRGKYDYQLISRRYDEIFKSL